MTSVVIIESPNARDISGNELSTLRTELATKALAAGRTDLAFGSAAEQPAGIATTFDEVLRCFLPSADFLKDEFYLVVVTGLVKFMRRRFGPREEETARPRWIVFFKDGKAIRAIELTSPEDDPAERDPAEWDPLEPPDEYEQ